MDNSFDHEEFKAPPAQILSAGFQIFDTIEKWLAGLFELSEEEQEEAGIHFGDQWDK